MLFKRLVVFALCAMMIVGLFPSSALAESTDDELPPDTATAEPTPVIKVSSISISTDADKAIG